MITGTVVVATRNRPDGARRAIASVRAALPDGWDAVVVDQSDTAETAAAIAGLLNGDGRITLLRSSRRGLSAARNDGSRAARGRILAFTDDDCVVDGHWASDWREAFAADAAMGIGFGLVVAPPFDPSEGHTPAFDPGPSSHTHDIGIFRRGIAAVGMGANMAMRRDVLEAVGGFDERLGAGCRFGGAEETDAAYRVARRGHRIGHVATAPVVHHGFRPRSQASALSQAYGLGTGAMYAKHIRAGDVYAAELALRETAQLCAKIARGCITGRRPLGARALKALVLGMTTSARIDVDRASRLYTSPA